MAVKKTTKIIFRRVKGRVVPVRLSAAKSDELHRRINLRGEGIKFTKELGRIKARTPKGHLKSIYNKYYARGLENMLRNDIPKTGALVHRRDNLIQISRIVGLGRDKKNASIAIDRIKKFLKENRAK